jgi:hypothetical protein
MAEYAPQAIKDMFARIQQGIPSALMGGIIGDSAHDYGYHRGRNYVSANDYSVTHPADQQGDGEAACGLDISWGKASDQYTVSQRLLNAKNDARMNCIREFFGSVDGYNVCGWDYTYNHWATSDSSHLWHIHISIHRNSATNAAGLNAVADVIVGSSPPPSGGNAEMNEAEWDRMENLINARVDWQLRNYFANGEGRPSNGRIFQAVNSAQAAMTDDALFVRFADAPLAKHVFLVTGGHLLLMKGDYGSTGLDMGWLKPRVLQVDSRSALYQLPIVPGTDDPRES